MLQAFFIFIAFIIFKCQAELVEAGISSLTRLRQAQADSIYLFMALPPKQLIQFIFFKFKISWFTIGRTIGHGTVKQFFNQNLHFPFG